ncbi:hypothetical protein SKAU_G00142710 [Synaphobranchus kaupii]|uniref:HMG domain-containing protein n=1 Tax=Synaphobranchus kaupii TaxID=118154 RepID=A0A9Q1FSJ6_SYNKA|nr:hypothetical protein SKAU_G00142710 [Synaphobranchus kaupii]
MHPLLILIIGNVLKTLDSRAVTQLFPVRNRACECGASFAKQPVASGQVRLYSQSETRSCQTHHYACSNPAGLGRLEFDGFEKFLINMGTYLVHHDITRDYMFHFLYSGTSMYNFHNSWMEILTDCGTTDTLPYKKFRWAWHAYLNLLDIPAAEGFYCAQCRDNPRFVGNCIHIGGSTTALIARNMLV